VITGFNTDVKHRNRVFHIQTEDKGESNPYVESLVYVGGEILATKRTSYAEVIKATGRDDHAVQDLMEQQHRTMIAAIQRGRFDGPNGAIQIPEGMSPSGEPEPVPASASAAKAERPSKKVKGDATAPPGTESPMAPDRTLDQMVLEYLVSDEVPEEMELSFSPAPDFTSGRSVQTKLKAVSGSPARPVGGAIVQVRVLSTSARASTVFQGKTASDGSCPISFMVPSHPNGMAAAVFRVTAPDATAEIQFPIKRR
jgi:hypothetical protein